jgi:hypothetical protein
MQARIREPLTHSHNREFRMSLFRRTTRICTFAMLSIVALSFVSCGRSKRFAIQKKYDPATAAAKAMEVYDRNQDGKLSAEEIKASPGLTDAASRIDKNRDGILTAGELQARFQTLDSQAPSMLLHVDISLKRAPLAGASVTFVPELFMGDGLQSYVGTTTDAGVCDLKGERAETLGIPSGFYQVKVVHPGRSINALRGVEIADDTTGNRLEIAL